MKNLLARYKTLGDAGFLLIANLIVNIGNYGLNIILGRWLGPEGFADANLLATLVMLLSFVAMGLQLVIAKYSAIYHAEKNDLQSDALINSSKSFIIKASTILMLVLVLCAPMLKTFFNLSSVLSLIILLMGIPFYFLMSLSRGYFQGKSQFRKLAKTYLIEMFGRVVLTVGLLFFFNNKGYSAEIVSLGFLFSFVICYFYSHVKVKAKTFLSEEVVQNMIKVFAVIGIYELSQILINNSDVILVKHYFENTEAGLYASLALLGRAVFFATWIIVTMLFPKVIEKEKRGEAHLHFFWNAFGIVAAIGLSIVGVCFILGDFIIGTAFGSEYLSISHLLWMYALSTTLFACANVVVYYNMSLDKYLPIWISVIAGIVQIITISLVHSSLEVVIQIQLIIMASLLGIMLFYHKYSQTQLNTTSNKILIKKSSNV